MENAIQGRLEAARQAERDSPANVEDIAKVELEVDEKGREEEEASNELGVPVEEEQAVNNDPDKSADNEMPELVPVNRPITRASMQRKILVTASTSGKRTTTVEPTPSTSRNTGTIPKTTRKKSPIKFPTPEETKIEEMPPQHVRQAIENAIPTIGRLVIASRLRDAISQANKAVDTVEKALEESKKGREIQKGNEMAPIKPEDIQIDMPTYFSNLDLSKACSEIASVKLNEGKIQRSPTDDKMVSREKYGRVKRIARTLCSENADLKRQKQRLESVVTQLIGKVTDMLTTLEDVNPTISILSSESDSEIQD